MGDFTLGQLIGQHQSFDPNIGSWENLSTGSFHLESNEVHSSNLSAEYFINSDSTEALLRYDYEPVNKFTDIVSHTLNLNFWGKRDTSAGIDVTIDISSSGDTISITQSDSLSLHSGVFNITNSIQLTAHMGAVTTDSSFFSLDDVLVELDRQILHPDWSYVEQQQNIENKQVSIGGKSEYFKYGELYRWQIPLTFMPNSQAELINFWFENKENLLFSPDTSNSNLKYITRIVHKPFTNFTHNNRMNGVIELESITNGLVF